jgi:hypothetical protein
MWQNMYFVGPPVDGLKFLAEKQDRGTEQAHKVFSDLKLTRQLTLINSSWAANCVRELKLADISGTISVPMIRTSNVTMEADRLTYILHPQNFNRD